MQRTLFIVPAYNEEESIDRVINELRGAYPDSRAVVINDGSTDRTYRDCSCDGRAGRRSAVDSGIGAAVQTGFILAARHGYDFAVQFDGDGQHLATEVPKLLKPILAGEADVVIGSRFLENGNPNSPLLRRIGISIFSFVNTMLIRRRMTDTTSGFRAYNSEAIRYLSRNYPHDYPEPESIVTLARGGDEFSRSP